MYIRAWQCLRVVDALARSGLRHLGGQYRQPRGRGAGLFLETAGERVIDVLQSERANGRTHQARGGRGENAVEERVVARHFVDALCAWKSKTDVPRFSVSHVLTNPHIHTVRWYYEYQGQANPRIVF